MVVQENNNNMERLTIKELAPYLPYDLKGVDYFQGHRLIRDITLHNVMAIVDGDTKLKPLLRPISSITEEIEHNGESFVPTVWLRDNHSLFGIQKLDMEKLIQMVIWVFNDVKSAPYYFVEKLHEWHFDTANLLGRGLALPIEGKGVKP